MDSSAQTSDIYSFTILEARSQKSRCWQGCIPSGGFKSEFFACFKNFFHSGDQTQALYILVECSTTELHPQLQGRIFKEFLFQLLSLIFTWLSPPLGLWLLYCLLYRCLLLDLGLTWVSQHDPTSGTLATSSKVLSPNKIPFSDSRT